VEERRVLVDMQVGHLPWADMSVKMKKPLGDQSTSKPLPYLDDLGTKSSMRTNRSPHSLTWSTQKKWVVTELPENEPRMYAIHDALVPGDVPKGQWHFSRGWVKSRGYHLDFPFAVDDAAHATIGLEENRAAAAAAEAAISSWKMGFAFKSQSLPRS
jgi:hypothetical protein